jgi:hypothetical protein
MKHPAIHVTNHLFYLLCLVLLIGIAGCVAESRVSYYNSNAKVRIQVCLPNKRVYFKDIILDKLENHPLFTEYSQQQIKIAPRTIRRVKNSEDPRVIHNYGIGLEEVLFRDGMHSASTSFIPLHDSTVSDQPVYERARGRSAQEYVAIGVYVIDKSNASESRVEYWFRLPKNIPNDRFTDWFDPISMEGKDKYQNPSISWKLTHGKDLTSYPASADSPKMRVSFKKNFQDFPGKHDDPTVDILPALTTARMKYRTTTSGKDFVYEFVEKTNDVIPACD